MCGEESTLRRYNERVVVVEDSQRVETMVLKSFRDWGPSGGWVTYDVEK